MPSRSLVFRLILSLGAAAGLALCPGCSTPIDDASFTIPERSYPLTFDRAKRLLTRRGFTLERVDADAGLITTRPKSTAGIATPWDRDQATPADEWADLAHQHERVVRVRFEPSSGPEQAPDSVRVRVEVDKLRVMRPGVNPSPSAVRYTTTWSDPLASARGVGGGQRVPVGSDRPLASKLAGALADLEPDPPSSGR